MSKRDYIQTNKDWLLAKSKEEGVKALPKGIYYKVLAEGNASSAQPTVRSIITAHYTGNTIDGKQFDSSHYLRRNAHADSIADKASSASMRALLDYSSLLEF